MTGVTDYRPKSLDGVLLNGNPLVRLKPLVAGMWRESRRSFDVVSPVSGHSLAQVCDTDEEAAWDAVREATLAQAAWARTTVAERSAALRRWHDHIIAHRQWLAELVVAEVGKPIGEANAEVNYAAGYIARFAEQACRSNGEVLPSYHADRRYRMTRHPVGVCVAITPWNFPLAMVTRKAAPAIAAGCAVIVKPSEQSPLSALALTELAINAGIPPGVLNVVPCSRGNGERIAKLFCESPDVRHLSCTGSTPVGRILAAQCAGTLKRLSLELGGHAPALVFDDADLDNAATSMLAGKLRNAGQACIAVNRVYVHRAIHDGFLVRLKHGLQDIRQDAEAEWGSVGRPLINTSAVQRFNLQVQDAISLGGSVVAGGVSDDPWRVRPTIICNATSDMLCMRNETFGPLLPITTFESDVDALESANSTEYGLAAYGFTQNLARSTWLSEELKFGMVGINQYRSVKAVRSARVARAGGGPTQEAMRGKTRLEGAEPQLCEQYWGINTCALSAAEAPFGGIGQSGYGREGGQHGLDEYLDQRTLCVAYDEPFPRRRHAQTAWV